MTGVTGLGYRVRRIQTNRNRLWRRFAFPICIRNGAKAGFELRATSFELLAKKNVGCAKLAARGRIYFLDARDRRLREIIGSEDLALSCALCEERKEKRFCPAVHGKICPQCCGEQREVTLDCPSDCPYLLQSRQQSREHATARTLSITMSGRVLWIVRWIVRLGFAIWRSPMLKSPSSFSTNARN